MTQEEFDELFISKSELCNVLGKAHNYLVWHIKSGAFPAPLELKSRKDKVFHLYFRDDIKHLKLIEGVL